MREVSEKLLYGQALRDSLVADGFERVLWGEDLYDYRIIPYTGSLREARERMGFHDRLTEAVLIHIETKKQHPIKRNTVNYHADSKVVFIQEAEFNMIWQYLRKGVTIGLEQHEEECQGTTAEEIVDLSLMQRDTSDAVIKDDRIAYIERKVSEDKKEARARMQSALDNPNNRYFYSKSQGFYHDRDCEFMGKISPEDFLASAERPEKWRPCRRCLRQMCLRELCSPYIKQIPLVGKRLQQYQIATSYLEKMAFDYGLKIQVGEGDALLVKGAEDTWLIMGFDRRYLSLWHNNYVKTSPTERYITQGFHKQGIRGNNLYGMFEFIHNYSFGEHLVSSVSESIDSSEEKLAEEEKTTKKNIFRRMLTFFRKLGRKNTK